MLAGAIGVGSAAAQDPPSPSFELKAPKPCVAGSCQAEFVYAPDNDGPRQGYTIEIEWDHEGRYDQNFKPDTSIHCFIEAYEGGDCRTTSPVFTRAANTQVVARITADGGASTLGNAWVDVLDPSDAPAPLIVKARKPMVLPRDTITVYTPKEQVIGTWFSLKRNIEGNPMTGFAHVTRTPSRLTSGPYKGMFRHRMVFFAPRALLNMTVDAFNTDRDYEDKKIITRRVKKVVCPALCGFFPEIRQEVTPNRLKGRASIYYAYLKPSRFRVRVKLVKRQGGKEVVLQRRRTKGRTSVKFGGSYSISNQGAKSVTLSGDAWRKVWTDACSGTSYAVVATFEAWRASGRLWKRRTLRQALETPDCATP